MAQRRQQAIAEASALVAGQLEEANQWGIARLMEIFGADFVAQIADNARERYEAAQALPSQAEGSQPHGTAVTTSMGAARTLGGVFFYLIREHSNSLGLDWYGLRIPFQPRVGAPSTTPQTQRAQQPSETATEATRPAPQPPQTPQPQPKPEGVTTPVTQTAAPAVPVSDAAPKPNRIKATVIGSPRGEPQPTDQAGVLQLTFDVEMSTSMPKGLPTLGRSRVVVLCTEKQYRPIAAAGGVTGRMLVEGEVAPTLSAAGKPIQVLVCTRLTTLDLEQAKRSAGGSRG